MTFDDDFVQVDTLAGARRYTLKSLGLEWPPPERIEVMGFGFQRASMSEIPDEARAGITCVCRGAAYESESNPPPDSIFAAPSSGGQKHE